MSRYFIFLISLNGLENLTTVLEDLELENNPLLASITSLSGVSGSVGDLKVINSNLTDLNGLQNITSVNEDLELDDNASLIDISALSNISSVGSDLEIFDAVFTDFSGLSGIVTIGKDLTIDDCLELETITGFNPNLTFVNLYITDNPKLTSIEGLPKQNNLEFVQLDDNPLLTDIDIFENITTLGGVFISDIAITNVDTFGNIESITDNSLFSLIEGDQIETINLDVLLNVSDELIVTCPNLISACGLYNYVNSGNGTSTLTINSGVTWQSPQDVLNNCALLGITDINISDLVVYPNPAVTSFRIQGVTDQIDQVKIFDINGGFVK
ncbi:hypothetical protein [uncultured Aquimarina sp.]|uniref:hypothetical protein n=1 Tax=uncultured Aquimarina sp. TaxID=575652 RepID=UPI0026331608|nr:hypothetical protein [uncultured Aquimarina sp.]